MEKKSIKINLQQIDIHQKDYEEYLKIYGILDNAKSLIDKEVVTAELEKIMDYVKFNYELSLSCVFTEIERIKDKQEREGK